MTDPEIKSLLLAIGCTERNNNYWTMPWDGFVRTPENTKYVCGWSATKPMPTVPFKIAKAWLLKGEKRAFGRFGPDPHNL